MDTIEKDLRDIEEQLKREGKWNEETRRKMEELKKELK